MIKKIESKNMGSSDHGWLKSKFHFSFADYYNPANINYGVLRVINDDIILPNTGFDTHPHKDMEIITYVVDGALTHADSIGNRNTLYRGEVQYMSAGSGIFHSEHNLGNDPLRLLQIWIYPDQLGYPPNYGDYRFDEKDRLNQLLLMVSGTKENAPIRINQDMNIYSTELEADKELNFKVSPNRQVYLVLIEGESVINQISVSKQDALEIREDFLVKAIDKSHLLIFEMNRS